jgi:hypothetical protein
MSPEERWRSSSTNGLASLDTNSTWGGATGHAAREHVRRFFAVAEDLFIGAPTHYQRFYRIEERSVTVIAICKEPINAAIALSDEASLLA